MPETAYICEAAIDAISLYLLLARNPANRADGAMYCSIGGVANQQRIDGIKALMAATGGKAVIAMDNDEAGAKCRLRNPDCGAMAIPQRKDWNEDWQVAIGI